jgi:hypothetical protein
LADQQALILVDRIEPLILEVRGQKALLDKDLVLVSQISARKSSDTAGRFLPFRRRGSREGVGKTWLWSAHPTSVRNSVSWAIQVFS